MKSSRSGSLSLTVTLLALSGLLLATTPVGAQFDNVGSITFPTSASPEAQQHFLRGVAILHSFGWKQAIVEFHKAQEIDPDFALAYWGETLCYNHPLFGTQDDSEPRKVLQRLGTTRAQRLTKAPTEREKGLLTAVEILWGEGDTAVRRVGYMEAMEELHDRYPADDEIAAFYALSMLSAARATGDDGLRLEVHAGAIVLDIFSRNTNHPGAPHYTIHSFDDPIHAPLALAAALRYAEIAPAVSHARHMPTHIFIQHGMWEMVSYHNQFAYDAARNLWEPGDSVSDMVHALDWGQYGDLQRGDYEKGRLWIERLQTVIDDSGKAERSVSTMPLLEARYVVETEKWNMAPITKESRTVELLATGLSAVQIGDLDTAKEAEKALAIRVIGGGETRGRAGDRLARIMHHEVTASIAAAERQPKIVIAEMDKAIAIVDAMRLPNGAASPVKPPFEFYGELLLQIGRPEDAIGKFERSLERMPNRPRSLLGLARAHARTNQVAKAAEIYLQLTEVWLGRELFAGYQEAERYLSTIGVTSKDS